MRTTEIGNVAWWCKPGVSIGWLSFGKGEGTRAVIGIVPFDRPVAGTNRDPQMRNYPVFVFFSNTALFVMNLRSHGSSGRPYIFFLNSVLRGVAVACSSSGALQKNPGALLP